MDMSGEKRVLPAVDRKAIDAYIDAHYIRRTAAGKKNAEAGYSCAAGTEEYVSSNNTAEYSGPCAGTRFSLAPSKESSVICVDDKPQYFKARRPVRHREDILTSVLRDGFAVHMQEIMDEKGMSAADVYKNAEIDKSTFSKILNDRDYTIGRDTAIQICIALGLTRDLSNALLKTAGYTLTRSSLRDVIIEYCMENRYGKVVDVDIVLHDYHCRTFVKK